MNCARCNCDHGNIDQFCSICPNFLCLDCVEDYTCDCSMCDKRVCFDCIEIHQKDNIICEECYIVGDDRRVKFIEPIKIPIGFDIPSEYAGITGLKRKALNQYIETN